MAWNKWVASILLLTFLVGQAIAVTHSHTFGSSSKTDSTASKQYVDNLRCPICHQGTQPLFLFHFHHTIQVLPVVETEFNLFIPTEKTVRLPRTGNRAPPLC